MLKKQNLSYMKLTDVIKISWKRSAHWPVRWSDMYCASVLLHLIPFPALQM